MYYAKIEYSPLVRKSAEREKFQPLGGFISEFVFSWKYTQFYYLINEV